MGDRGVDRVMPPPPYACRLCGAEYEPEEERQKYCSEDCEYRAWKIDEKEQRREERCEDYCAETSFCECNVPIDNETEEEKEDERRTGTD